MVEQVVKYFFLAKSIPCVGICILWPEVCEIWYLLKWPQINFFRFSRFLFNLDLQFLVSKDTNKMS